MLAHDYLSLYYFNSRQLRKMLYSGNRTLVQVDENYIMVGTYFTVWKIPSNENRNVIERN